MDFFGNIIEEDRLDFFEVTFFISWYFTEGNTSCRDPHPLPILQQGLFDETSLIMPGYVRDVETGDLTLVPEMYKNITRTLLSNPVQFPPSPRTPCSVRSTCPWKYVVNKDENRIPKKLVEAQCVSKSCKGPGHPWYRNTVCREVLYYIRVLRRVGCLDNVYQYQELNEPVAAGCSCFGSVRDLMPI